MASDLLFPTDEQNEDSSEKNRNEELFVFGYHCKLFRDDEQAKMVDLGTYMIPWMGDEKLKIDRSVFSSTWRGLLSIVYAKGLKSRECRLF